MSLDVQIYNENLRDLLSEDGKGEALIREDPKTGIYIQTKEKVRSQHEWLNTTTGRCFVM